MKTFLTFDGPTADGRPRDPRSEIRRVDVEMICIDATTSESSCLADVVSCYSESPTRRVDYKAPLSHSTPGPRRATLDSRLVEE